MPTKSKTVQMPTDYGTGNFYDANSLQSYHYVESKSSPKREYFSGANAKVYFGDVWVDQITEISFSLQEQVAPIYGFQSYTFDRISRGSRMVTGQFTINFTENGYLQSILKRIEDNMRPVSGFTKNPPKDKYIRDISELDTIKDLLLIDDKDVYTQQVNALKDSFWGNTGGDGSDIVPIKENDTYYYTRAGDGDSTLKRNGFNILIDYSPDANLKDFQDCLNGMNKENSAYQTYRNIIGVHLGSESQSIINNGQIITQTYQFVAQDLDGDITQLSLHNK